MYRTPNEQFRERLYEFLKSTLSPSMTKDDLDIMIHLLSIVIGDRDYDMYELQYYTSIDHTPSHKLRQLGSNVAFPWSSALTPEQQRQYIKLYHLIRQRRSTGWSIENLCRVFGQDTNSYYTNADLSSIRLLEYPINYSGEAPKDSLGNNLPFCYQEEGAPEFPGDMVLRIPAISTILYNEIMNTKLAGTRLMFLFYFLMGPFNIWPNVNNQRLKNFFFIPAYGKDDIKISDWKTIFPNTKEPTRIIKYMADWNVCHYVVNYNVNASMIMRRTTSVPYETGWILHEPNDENYRGYWITDGKFVEDNTVWYN